MSKTSTKTLAKATTAQITTLPPTFINHAADTIITLPSSKKTIVIQKGLPANMIAELDKYFKTHKNLKTKNITVSPNTVTCGLHIATYWEIEDQYQSVTGKALGIWDEARVSNWPNYHNNWGFKELLYSYPSNYSTAVSAGFKADSMLAHLIKGTNYQTYVTNWNTDGVHRYIFDEPYDSYSPPNLTTDYVINACNWIKSNYPSSSVALDDYEDNGEPYFNWYQQTIQLTSNTYMMCDQYQSGQTYLWQHYPDASYFGAGRANVGGNFVDYNHDYSENMYSTLFGLANNLGMNQIWFYADDPADPSTGLASFANAAWANGWLLRLEKQVTTVWKCLEYPSCTDCVYPTQGGWYVYESYYTGEEQWVTY